MRIVILAEQGVQDQELFGPLYIAQYEGYTVDVATLQPNRTGKYGIPIKNTKIISELNPDDYEAVIVGGGWQCPELLRQDETTLKFIRDMYDKNKVVAAICHGPLVLISAGIMKTKKATCYKGMKDDLVNAGAEYLAKNVVEDGNIVTSPHYDNIPEFMREIIRKLNGRNA